MKNSKTRGRSGPNQNEAGVRPKAQAQLTKVLKSTQFDNIRNSAPFQSFRPLNEAESQEANIGKKRVVTKVSQKEKQAKSGQVTESDNNQKALKPQ